jgi:hypothetical protein
MATVSSSVDTDTSRAALVDPRAPRFGQALTASGLFLGILIDAPILVYLVTAVLLTAVVTRWRYDPYATLWRLMVLPAVSPAEEPEPAAPHRFAKLLGTVGTSLASLLLLAGIPLAGYALAGAVAVAAGLAAVTGLCIGCRLYRQVSFFRQHSIL